MDTPGLAQKLTPAIEEVRTLTREIQDMELELAMLRNSRPEEERMTVSEANQSLDDQVRALGATRRPSPTGRLGRNELPR